MYIYIYMYVYIDIVDVMSRHHGEDGGDEPPKHPPTIPGDCESALPPKRRQYSKSLTVY